MRHLDVAGGTGDVAFRVLRAIRQAELEGQARPSSSSAAGKPSTPPAPGSVVVCDINPQMLAEGKKKAQQAADLSGLGWGNARQTCFIFFA